MVARTLPGVNLIDMKKADIKRYLKDYSIYNNRRTTINHAFCSALSVADKYDENKVDRALRILGEDPENDLNCVYCGSPADTWDHIMATVKNGQYSGFGHQIGNLIPCCKECNSKKGNKEWKAFLISKRPAEKHNPIMIKRIQKYIKLNTSDFVKIQDKNIRGEIERLNQTKEMILKLLRKGDRQAAIIRQKLRDRMKQSSNV
jgi:endonuclease I